MKTGSAELCSMTNLVDYAGQHTQPQLFSIVGGHYSNSLQLPKSPGHTQTPYSTFFFPSQIPLRTPPWLPSRTLNPKPEAIVTSTVYCLSVPQWPQRRRRRRIYSCSMILEGHSLPPSLSLSLSLSNTKKT